MEDAYLFRHGLAPSSERPVLADRPQTIPVLLNRCFLEHPERDAVVTSDEAHSYEALFTASQRAAAVLADWGIEAGDRVAGALPDGIDFVVALLGTLRLGAVWVGLPAAASLERKVEILAATDAELLLTDAETHDRLEPQRSTLRDLARVVVAERGSDEWRAELERETVLDAYLDVDPFAPAVIGHGEGPEGIVHSQHNLLLPGNVAAASGRTLVPVAGALTSPSALVARAFGAFQAGRALDLRPEADTPDAETGLLASVAPGPITLPEAGAPAGSRGRASAQLDVVVLGADDRPVPDGEPGDLCLRAAASGPFAGAWTPPLGLWNQPDATGALLRAGCARTGRRGSIDADGHVFPAD